MDEITAMIRENQWAKIINECNKREPGMTKRAWCELNGINLKSFYYHQRKLRYQIALKAVSAVSDNSTSGILPVPSAFADITEHVSVHQSSAIDNPNQDTYEASISPELMIQAGCYKVFVASSVRESTLETVLRVISHA